jgi:predicted TIM-barrel enzyme
VAKVVGVSFVRVGALVGATLTAHGLVQPDALADLENQRKISAERMKTIADMESIFMRACRSTLTAWPPRGKHRLRVS